MWSVAIELKTVQSIAKTGDVTLLKKLTEEDHEHWWSLVLILPCLERALWCQKMSPEVKVAVEAIVKSVYELIADGQDKSPSEKSKVCEDLAKAVKVNNRVILEWFAKGFDNHAQCAPNATKTCILCSYKVQSEKSKISTFTFGSDSWTHVDIKKLHLSSEYPKSVLH